MFWVPIPFSLINAIKFVDFSVFVSKTTLKGMYGFTWIWFNLSQFHLHFLITHNTFYECIVYLILFEGHLL